jgi:hypothetical protein
MTPHSLVGCKKTFHMNLLSSTSAVKIEEVPDRRWWPSARLWNDITKKTNSMELSHSLEAASCEATQEFLNIFFEPERFVTVFITAHHWSPSWARSIEFIQPLPISPWSRIILSTCLHLGVLSRLFPSVFLTNNLHAFFFSPFEPHALVNSSSLTWPFHNQENYDIWGALLTAYNRLSLWSWSPLERANFNHWIRVDVSLFFHLKTEAGTVSETLCFLVI